MSAAVLGPCGHGTARITGAAAGPAKGETRIWSMRRAFRGAGASLASVQRCVGDFLQGFEAKSLDHFAHGKTFGGDIKDGEIGIDALDGAARCEREGTTAAQPAFAGLCLILPEDPDLAGAHTALPVPR